MRWMPLLVLVACGAKEEASLATPGGWTLVPLAEDPFADRHPGGEVCPAASFGPEELSGEMSFGVDGLRCLYLTVRQDSLVEIDEGDLLHYRLWHFELVGLDAATATISMTIDGQPIIEERIPVPSPSTLRAPYFDANFSAPSGSEVLLHLENHGSNSYNLIEVTRGGERPETQP